MDVSVVIPYYGRRELLLETLRAIGAQSVLPEEIVIVDDGAPEPLSLPDGAAGTVPVRLHRTENRGVSVARNTGVDLAVSAWIAFCDSDDLWLPQKLERQLELVAKKPGVEYCVANFRYLVGDVPNDVSKFEMAPRGWWEGIFTPGEAHGVAYEPIARRVIAFNPIFPSALLLSRRFFERAGRFNPRFSRHRTEDLELHLRATEHPPLGFVREPLVHVRRHQQNYSGDILQNLLSEIDILKYVRDERPGGASYRAELEDALQCRTVDAIGLAYEGGRFDAIATLAPELKDESIGRKLRMKLFIARMPEPLRALLWKASRATAARTSALRPAR